MAPNENVPRQTRGSWGEERAVEHLVREGYAIMCRNWRMGHYEIDIVAQLGGCIVFVEVKTRKVGGTDPVLAVDERKRARIARSADVFLRHYELPFEYRFDIVSVVGETMDDVKIEHIPDAYVPKLRRFGSKFKI